MSTRYDARRSYQRTALDRRASTATSLLLVAIALGVLVFAGIAIKAKADAFVNDWNELTNQQISATDRH